MKIEVFPISVTGFPETYRAMGTINGKIFQAYMSTWHYKWDVTQVSGNLSSGERIALGKALNKSREDFKLWNSVVRKEK